MNRAPSSTIVASAFSFAFSAAESFPAAKGRQFKSGSRNQIKARYLSEMAGFPFWELREKGHSGLHLKKNLPDIHRIVDLVMSDHVWKSCLGVYLRNQLKNGLNSFYKVA